ncbi:hypothetical protein HK096_001125, partial [Nowakowskiella sp. JEL0078]
MKKSLQAEIGIILALNNNLSVENNCLTSKIQELQGNLRNSIDIKLWENEKMKYTQSISSLEITLSEKYEEVKAFQEEIIRIKLEMEESRKANSEAIQNLKEQFTFESTLVKNGETLSPKSINSEYDIRLKMRLELEEIFLVEKKFLEDEYKRKSVELMEIFKKEKSELIAKHDYVVISTTEKHLLEKSELEKNMKDIISEFNLTLRKLQEEKEDLQNKFEDFSIKSSERISILNAE